MSTTKGIVSPSNYRFNAASRTITFSSDYTGIALSDITYITNIKSGVATVIYDPFDATKGGTLSGLTLTLAFNTTSMSNDDPLQIIVGFIAPPDFVEDKQEQSIDLLQNISDNLDLLAATADQTERIELNVREVSTRRDLTGATVLSDSVPYTLNPPKILRAAGEYYSVDTSGYNTTIFTISGVTNAASATITVDTGESEAAYFPCFYYLAQTGNNLNLVSAGTSASINNNIVYTVVVPNVGKFARLRMAGGTASFLVSATLRNIPYIGNNGGPVSNILINGANPSSFLTGATSSTAPNIAQSTVNVGGSSFPTNNPPNISSTLNTSVPYPIGVAGRELPNMNALSGIFRYLTLDSAGRVMIGGDTPETETRTQSKLASGAIPGLPPRGIGARPNTMQGSQALFVEDTSQVEGDTNTMLLKQILQELKILNQQITELPMIVNTPSYKMSDPQEYRDDNSTLF